MFDQLKNFVQTLIHFLFGKPIWFFIITTLFFCGEQILLGPFSYFNFDDTMQHSIPSRISIINNLFSHGISYWFPGVAGGIDLFSSGSVYASIRDAGLLSLFLPVWLAHQLTLFFGIFCSGLFTYLICNKQLFIPNRISLFAGFIFQYAVPYTYDVGSSFFPMFLYLFSILSEKKYSSINFLYLIGLSLFYSLVSNPILHFSYLILLPLWLFFISKISYRKILIYYFFLVLVYTIYNYPYLIALSENFVISHRTLSNPENLLLWRRIFYSHTYGNFFPWVILYGFILFISVYRKNKKFDKIFIKLVGFLLLFSFGTSIIYFINH